MSPPDAEVPYGTLDLMVLKTLAAMGPLHGYGIARRIEQVAAGRAGAQPGHDLSGAAAPRAAGWIPSAWGMSENNRRARFYSITAAGRRQLAAETALWARTVPWSTACWRTIMTRLRVLLSRALDVLFRRRRDDG